MRQASLPRFPGSRIHYLDRGPWLFLEERRGGRRARRGIAWLWRCPRSLELHFTPTAARAEASASARTAAEALSLLAREPGAMDRFAYDRAVLHVLDGDAGAARLLLRAVLVGEAQPEIGVEGLRRALVLYDAIAYLPRAVELVRGWVGDARALLGLAPWSAPVRPTQRAAEGVSLAR